MTYYPYIFKCFTKQSINYDIERQGEKINNNLYSLKQHDF